MRLKLALPAAFGGGVLHVLTFAPFHWWPLQFVLLGLLFHSVFSQNAARTAGLLGWAFGTGWAFAGVYWLTISMVRYGGLPLQLALLALLLLALLLGAFTGIGMAAAAVLQRRFDLTRPAMLLLVLPASFALSDWARGWVLTGFPWIVTGYAHTDSPLAGFAPILGVYGIGWLAALIGGSLMLVRSRRSMLLLPILLLPVMILATGAVLRHQPWTSASGAPLSVRLLQGNVPQDQKFVPTRLQSTLDMTLTMVSAAAADLIATPETALPIPSNLLAPEILASYADFARSSGSTVVLGIPAGDDQDIYANSAFGFTPDGQRLRYDKHHLVPFGEFVPFGFRWFVDMMRIPLGDFTPGPLVQSAFTVRDQRVLPNICYEDLFGEQIAAQLRASAQPATILLNMSNIAWFGDSIALPQHLQISRMRVLETGRPMLRATNTGMTAVIRADGQVQAQLAPLTRDVLSATVQGTSGLTPYVQMGNVFPVGLCLFCLMFAVIPALRRRAQKVP